MIAKTFLLFFFSLIIFSLVSAESVPQGSAAYNNDNDVLNFALVLEDLEASYYNALMEKFTQADFEGYPGISRPYLELIRQHENAHVNLLRGVLKSRGLSDTDIVSNCTYDFSKILTDLPTAIAAAAAFENLGVSAYDGAATSLTDSILLTSAVSIAEVEARHAAFLNTLVNFSNPYPNVTDPTVTPKDAYMKTLTYQTCQNGDIPASWMFPVVADSYRNFTNTTLFSQNKPNPGTPAYVNDNNVLNYALFLEYFEYYFYLYVEQKFGDNLFDSMFNHSVSAYYNMIRSHENAHSVMLKDVLATRTTAYVVTPCTYSYTSVQTLDQVLAITAALETNGAGAYEGQAASLTDSDLLMVAGTIATVESRQAAFVRLLLGQVPFPNVTSPSLTTAQVMAAVNATGFLVNCSAATNQLFANLPVAADNFRPVNNGRTATTTSPTTGTTSSTTSRGTTSSTASTASTSSSTSSRTTTSTTKTSLTVSTTNLAGSSTSKSSASTVAAAVVLIIIAALL